MDSIQQHVALVEQFNMDSCFSNIYEDSLFKENCAIQVF